MINEVFIVATCVLFIVLFINYIEIRIQYTHKDQFG